MTDDDWYLLPAPAAWGQAERAAFIALARAISGSPDGSGPDVETARRACVGAGQASLAAAAHVLCDLASQGWAVRGGRRGPGAARAASVADPAQEKERIRRQELVKRNEQLSQPSVRQFIVGDGTAPGVPRKVRLDLQPHAGRPGPEGRAGEAAVRADGDPSALRAAVDPYLQPVATGERCRHTGLLLTDIWRYFRHTWTNYYATTPGRTLALLVRDRAAPFHPVIGIAALSSAIMQISERDRLDRLAAGAVPGRASRRARPPAWRAGPPGGWNAASANCTWTTSSRTACTGRPCGTRQPRKRSSGWSKKPKPGGATTTGSCASPTSRAGPGRRDAATWQQRAESDLFRSKRCLALADLLRARAALIPFLSPRPTADGLRKALDDPQGRRAIAGILRRAKAESVGTEIADLAVCGAVAPYNAILGGKLVSMLAASPAAVRAYRDKYSGYESEIASAMAGRPIQRRANLVFLGTTSLYGSGSSQYNRIRIPAEVLGGTTDIRFRELGRSKSYGTSHLSTESVTALVRLAEQSKTGVRVNSIFGEGRKPEAPQGPRPGWNSSAGPPTHCSSTVGSASSTASASSAICSRT